MSWLDDLVEAVSPSRRAPAPRQTASITRPAVKKIVVDSLKSLCEELDRENAKRDRKLDKAAEQAKAAAKDAAEAKEAVERLVETARETFRDVIAELLEPHYRLLAQHLGIELPAVATKTEPAAKATKMAESSVTRKGTKTVPRESTSRKLTKKATAKTAAKNISRPSRKGVKPCRKK